MARRRREVRIPVPPDAPGFRDALTRQAGFLVRFERDSALVAPADPRGGLLNAHRLMAEGEDPARLREVIAAHPRREYDLSKHYERGQADINRMVESESREGVVGALVVALLLTPSADLPDFIESQLSGIFTAFPGATLWMLTADDRLLSRVSLTHILFQREMTPDLRLGDKDAPFRRSLQAQSSTQGVNYADAVQPILLAFSPAATGYAFAWPPHSLILEYGALSDLRRQWPRSLGALYESSLLAPPTPNTKLSSWTKETPTAALGTLLAWWIHCLDRLYTIATDPTRFPTDSGEHDSSAQLAYLLTLERVLADMRAIGSAPQASSLVRLNLAFDLYDKLETLQGYGPRAGKVDKAFGSGRGFEALLNRSRTLPILRQAFRESLPVALGSRFAGRASALFDEVYDELREGVLVSRLESGGVRVGKGKPELVEWDDYAGQVVRAVRNSSHGLLDQLAGPRADIAATHTGALPRALPELATMTALGLLANPETLWADAVT